MTPVFRGIFLTSENPGQTAAFYRETAGLDLEMVGDPKTYAYWRIDKDGVQIAIHDAKLFSAYTYPCNRESNTTHLYFKIESQSQFLERVQRLGIEPAAIDDVVVTLADPDGRMVMFGTA